MQLAVEDAVGKDLWFSAREGLGEVGLCGEGRGDGGDSRGISDGIERAVNQHGSKDHQTKLTKSFHHYLQKGLIHLSKKIKRLVN